MSNKLWFGLDSSQNHQVLELVTTILDAGNGSRDETVSRCNRKSFYHENLEEKELQWEFRRERKYFRVVKTSYIS